MSSVGEMQQSSKFDDPPPAYTRFENSPMYSPTTPLVHVHQPTAGAHHLTYGATGTSTVITISPNPAETIFLVGGCPACRVGVLQEEFTILGLLCAIVFFPLGILCCLALRQRRCLNCGAVF